MPLPLYDMFTKEISMKPQFEYLYSLQAMIDSQWENTTQLRKFLEQDGIGSKKYNPVECQISYQIEDSSTGTKNSDDIIKLSFRDINHATVRGLYYVFNDNYYITTGTSTTTSTTEGIVVRRCNNFLKYVDEKTKEIVSIPCVLSYDTSSPMPKQSLDIITPNNGVIIIVQGNEETKKIKVNQRFIFNGRPYKITGINNYLQNDYVTKDVTIYYWDAYYDEIQPTDDLENNVANRFEYDIQGDIPKVGYYVKMNPYFTSVKQNLDVEFVFELYKDGELIDEDIKVGLSNVPHDQYIFNKTGFNSCYLRALTFRNDKVNMNFYYNNEIVYTKEISFEAIF